VSELKQYDATERGHKPPTKHFHIQGPAYIPDDFAKQLWVEPLAWEVCPWALF